MGMIFNCYIFLTDQRNQFLQLQLGPCVSVICVMVHFRNKWIIGGNMNSHSSTGKSIWLHQFSSVQSLSRIWLFATPWTSVRQASLSITNSRSLPKLMSIKLVMPSSHLILCRPFLLLPSIFPSIRVFSNESTLHIRWPKYWSFNFSISPSNEHPGLISFRRSSQSILKETYSRHPKNWKKKRKDWDKFLKVGRKIIHNFAW